MTKTDYQRGWDALAAWLKLWFLMDLPDSEFGDVAKMKESLDRAIRQLAAGMPEEAG